MFFYGAAYQKSHSALFMLPEKGVPSAVAGTVCRWCQDYAAGLEESSTGEVPWLQKFCRHNCWVFAAPRKSKRQLTAESAECCRTRDGSRRPSRAAHAWTATGEPGMVTQSVRPWSTIDSSFSSIILKQSLLVTSDVQLLKILLTRRRHGKLLLELSIKISRHLDDMSHYF